MSLYAGIILIWFGYLMRQWVSKYYYKDIFHKPLALATPSGIANYALFSILLLITGLIFMWVYNTIFGIISTIIVLIYFVYSVKRIQDREYEGGWNDKEMKFGSYYIGQEYSEIIHNVREFTSSEYKLLPKAFKKENYYRGEQVIFCGTGWNTIISVLDNKIYKIILNSISISIEFYNKLLPELVVYFENTLGKFKHRDYYYKWNNSLVEIIIDFKDKPSVGIQIVSQEELDKQSFFEMALYLLKVPFMRIKLYYKMKKSEKH
jgi:hypothetical protein